MAAKTFRTLQHPVWERQVEEGESPEAHARLRCYLQQPPEHRTLDHVAITYRRTDQAVAEMAKAHRWEERAAAYDRHQQAQEIQRANHQLVTAELATALDLVRHLRTSLHTLTSHGGHLDPNEITALADAVTALHAAARQHADTSPGGDAE